MAMTEFLLMISIWEVQKGFFLNVLHSEGTKINGQTEIQSYGKTDTFVAK